VQYTHDALSYILESAASPNPVPLASYLRGDLSSSGAFPSYQPKDLKGSFRDFETAANGGYARAWFRIGRAYEDFGDTSRALSMYESGRQLNDAACSFRLAMASLSGQLGLLQDDHAARIGLEASARIADVNAPHCAFVWGMLLAGEFEVEGVRKDIVEVDVMEAKRFIGKSAYLDFGPAQHKMVRDVSLYTPLLC
jgi:TPR repeat protein